MGARRDRMPVRRLQKNTIAYFFPKTTATLGGGEGRTSGGRHPCSPWGKNSKGAKTRNNKRTDKFIVRHRQKRA